MRLFPWIRQSPASAAADSLAALETSALEALTAPHVQSRLILSAVVVLGLIVLRRVVLRLVEPRVENSTTLYWWSKSSGYAAFALSLFFVVQIWFSALRSLGTFLGLLTAGLAIALKDLVADLAGWAFILWRKPFELGDRIQIGDTAGDVVDIRLFAFTIMEIGNWVDADQSTGRMIHIPNADVFTDPLANYTAGFPFLWNEVAVMVTFESDWRKAKELLREIADEVTEGVSQRAERTLRSTSRRFLIHYSKLTPIIYTSVKDSGVMLTLRYLCDPRARRGTTEGIWERMLDAFAAHDDIDLAYPTQRVYLNPVEGKPGARAPWPPGRATDA
ncbi:MAG: mechanosensitive ion channel family protein [Longimicrobiales bacterium]|nr:mechanosensitive ion channel family protein [Longimicrobiales bacterium]